ncbi:acyltransferase domain-containing protein, partial [Oxalobacteraceae bacterium OM1]
PGVRNCAVIGRSDGGGEARLVAYVVAAGDAPGVSDLRTHVGASLPEFMVPSAFVFMDTLPLTVNGKLDRAALPAPASLRPELAQVYLEPADAQEALLCALFAEQLQLDRVGRLDNFFELGGSSLAATALAAGIKERNGIEISAAQVFNQPTPAGLAAFLRRDAADAAPAAAERREGSGRDAIAIVAMSGRFPGARDVEALWDNLRGGVDAVRAFTDAELDPSIPQSLRDDPAYVKARAVMDDPDKFDAAFFGISPREAEVMDPQQRVFLELCWDCLERGGYAPESQNMSGMTVGVFGGMHVGSYLRYHVRANAGAVDRVGELAVMLANEKDYIATRVAHRLDLTGPAVSVHTACSTSLVAVVQAVNSLRAGQCDMALAGGVSINCPPNSGYLYEEGAILSPDGHTRTFDADARGTVFGDGAAIVLLKRLADAQADGDPILAVIRGVAINNDGAHKASFTAPSVDGQATVIGAALADAGVQARDISYVEAHGTATPIGDPIEIEALTQAYRRHTAETAFCRIGSIKSNLGHLVTAAGGAGLIKTVLALNHEVIPPTVHFRTPNPKIDFDSTPFVVNGTATPWPRGDAPRLAGISSFGFGGTNAHVIVEEAPARPVSETAPGRQLLVLSARTPDAVQEGAKRLADHLAAHPDLNLADVAYTLRTGRKPMRERLCVTAHDAAEAAAILRAESSAFKLQGKTGARVPPVVFMFPGQAAQYTAMGSVLYDAQPAFRAAFDECLAALDGVLPFPLKDRIFSEQAASLEPTAVTQPALFCIEYALAKFWMSLGVQPVALIGHSVGEFVAATLAGVFELRDAIRLVARRGALMQSLPAGSMLAVRLGAAQLETRLPEGVCLAAENSPVMSVVAGPTERIEAFRAVLETEGVSAKLLQTSHAFHSSMMDPAVAPFEAEVRTCRLAAPALPIFSTVTGNVLTDAQACDPAYWAQHLREPVRFSRALQRMVKEAPGIFLEAGPRTTLATLTRQHLKAGDGVVPVASLADGPGAEAAQVLLA